MKNYRTLAVTLSIGSALAWVMSDSNRRRRIQEKGKSAIRAIKNLANQDDDPDFKYI